MTDVILELFRATLVLIICLTLAVSGRRRKRRTTPHWKTIMAGMWLILFGTLFDITDNFDSLNRFIVIGDTPVQAFLEKLVCYLGGFALLAWGLVKWLPLVDELESSEATLHELEQRYRTVTTMTSDFAFMASYGPEEKLILDWMEGPFEEITGYSPQEVPTSDEWSLFLHPEDLSRVGEHMRQLKQGKAVGYDCRIITKAGDERHIQYAVKPIRAEKGTGITHIIGAAQDITLRRRAEENMARTLGEKEILLQELHHRVKNNLQVVNSLVDIAARNASGERASESFREIQAKLRSMALVHSQLYTSQDMANVRFAEYARSLCGELKSMFNAPAVRLDYDLEEVSLPIGMAIPLGLVLNEAVTNALKHARADGTEPEVSIGLKFEDGILVLCVRDNGPGFPRDSPRAMAARSGSN